MSILSKVLKLFSKDKERDNYYKSSEDKTNDNINITEFEFVSDENLVQFIFDNISRLIGTYDSDEYKSVMKLNKPRQAIYMIIILESEVNNGGFELFYNNSSGEFHEHLPAALKRIGAPEYAKLMQKANNIFNQEEIKSSKSDNRFDELDTEFFNLYRTEDLYRTQVKYIRENKSEFIEYD